MTALHRMKAYFGMVPADELDAYDGYGYDDDRRRDAGRYESDRYGSERHGSERYASDRWDGDRRHESRYAPVGASAHALHEDDERRRERVRHDDARYDDARYDDARYSDERATRAPRPRDPEFDEAESSPAARGGQRGRGWAQNTGPNHTSVRGIGAAGATRSPLAAVGAASGSGSGPSGPGASAAASSTGASGPGPTSGAGAGTSLAGPAGIRTSDSGSSRGSTGDAGSAPTTRGSLAVDTARRREPEPEPVPAPEPAPAPAAPAEITTLRPTSYNEARVIGENYRDGIPVIMNLTDLDDVAAKRLVDFAAGLAFALRGSIEKVTSRVFLLSPPNVEVSAADRTRFAQGS